MGTATADFRDSQEVAFCPSQLATADRDFQIPCVQFSLDDSHLGPWWEGHSEECGFRVFCKAEKLHKAAEMTPG